MMLLIMFYLPKGFQHNKVNAITLTLNRSPESAVQKNLLYFLLRNTENIFFLYIIGRKTLLMLN